MNITTRSNVPGGSRLARGRNLLLLAVAASLLAGCAAKAPRNSVKHMGEVDRDTLEQMSRQLSEESRKLAENHDLLRERVERIEPLPALAPLPPAYDPLENQVVSIRMYEADVGQLLWAMADQLGMNLLMDPQVVAVQKRANLHMSNVSAREVFRNILDVFDLHGEVRGNTLQVGLMQERVFDLDFLNTRMNVNIASGGNVFGSNQSAGGDGGSGGGGSEAIRGNFSLSGGSGDDTGVFQQLESALERILGEGGQGGRAAEDGSAAGAPRNPELQPRYALNPTTGTLFVKARPSQVRSVEQIVQRYKSVLSRQVLIEAQLLDVELSDGFEFGVDWNLLRRSLAATWGSGAIELGGMTAPAFPNNSRLPLPAQITLPALSAGGGNAGSRGGLLLGNDSFAMAVNMLRSFGSVRVLSNPSIRARNGTPAMLSVGTNTRYVSRSTVTVTNPGGGATTASADVETDALFAGVVVGVVPFIREEGSVELLVHPMQTDVDPNSLALVEVAKTADGSSKVTLPVVNFKGMTTTLSLRDGDTVLLGGLIDQKTSNNNRGIPGAADVPGLGKLFGQEADTHKSREMVMILRVRVL
ncbi:pilus (MSHA type) biogenesis protein MshL [Thauera sp. CAU 1555]|uniref:Pilus (MSHA type) biogenesis protein MshL n=1 Tax=Thauera sedimentorum TaxID=2767595 RepID=A0ABR9BBB7_9RHOO|nr:pilus (MSHA type) biogenesis protein MshL [Thauera sedimentorum]MBC9072724.1 pilus (MSHA type) biogenesis protein MshL [Thauera sedimentorum]MBD8503643.1 pilus (MSHA type) biogenesis protein MshL [Thauera sedimentorum]